MVRPRGRAAALVADAVLVVVGVALLALSAQVTVPLWFTPVPITGQTFAVLLVGAAYGSVRGFATTGAYLLLGGLGAGVFADHASGWAAFQAPSGGYLVGMLVAALVVGLAAERGWDRRLLPSVLAMLLGSAVIYAFGLAWLGHVLHTPFATTWDLGAQPFLVADAVKLLLAAGVLPLAWRAVDAVRR